MLKSLISKFAGDPAEKTVRKYRWVVEATNALEPAMTALTDAELRGKTDAFRERVAAGESLDDLMPEAFAVVREASRRTIGLRHYDVQLIGGAVLHHGAVAEMKTGEGKTLVATLPLYLNALSGKGVHLVTPNDYLSKVGVQWMGAIYHFLGLSSGVIQNIGKNPNMASFLFDPGHHAEDDRYHNLRPAPRAEVYRADVTYGTNNEFGFDYLRDNMVWDLAQRVQRPLHYAIVDEVDNILIDEARTPLIISGPAEEAPEWYVRFADMARRLRLEEDYTVDEKTRVVTPTEEGIEKIERMLGIDNLYSPEHYELTSYFENALKAQAVFHLDQEYIVEDGEVVIVDEFTGRPMYGRRFSEGLHQAIEAKEGVQVQRESMTMATITFQNYFRMYEKLAGMTGTAMTEAEELWKIYELEVWSIPTHRPTQRIDASDLVYPASDAKWRAVVDEIAERHAEGQPVLVGTVSVENSEKLSKRLTRKGVPHEVLNAKNHEREAEIIAQAGRSGAVTIATNMAGRGVDILLGGNAEGIARAELRRREAELREKNEPDLAAVSGLDWDAAVSMLRDGGDPTARFPFEWARVLKRAWETTQAERAKVVELGGLFVLGTERHEARRIDNQLRGRAGRQGDPGESRFFVAMEDELMIRFGGERVKSLMGRLGVADDEVIESGMVTKQIESAQVKVEGYNFDMRKHLLEYDEVINKQRLAIYERRTQVLAAEDLRPLIWEMVEKQVEDLVPIYTASQDRRDWDVAGLEHAIRAIFPLPEDEDPEDWRAWSPDEIADHLLALAGDVYDQKTERLGAETMHMIERSVMLRTIDQWWIRHLTAVDELRTGISLRSYGQQDPLVTFKREGYQMYQNLLANITHDTVRAVFFAEPMPAEAPRPRPAATTRVDRGR
ncbi:MAG: preprotein translocase subunit SecA, partial [Chloroflexi bacterium CFX6]|nr:preprotein translocase subunit SecA [Chloroflexi bacterium CFX6]